jgi:hypothetical protein
VETPPDAKTSILKFYQDVVSVSTIMDSIVSNGNCTMIPNSALYSNNHTFLNLTLNTIGGCQVQTGINLTTAQQQSGAIPIQCGPDSDTIPVEFLPIGLWFLQYGSVQTLICYPYIRLFSVKTSSTINSTGEDFEEQALYLGLTGTHQLYTGKPNNVSGSPTNGRAYNGYHFQHPSLKASNNILTVDFSFLQQHWVILPTSQSKATLCGHS